MKFIFYIINYIKKGFIYFLIFYSSFITNEIKAQNWSAVGNGIGDGVNASVVYDGYLVVGGSFTDANGVVANYIARWNGTSWDALGNGLNGWVNALTVFNGELIAGGSFSHAGDITVNNIARWDGINWKDMSGGVNGTVSALKVYNNQLIAGGSFTDAGGVPVNNIAAWDMTGWNSLGAGTGGPKGNVLALDNYGNYLIAAGSFTIAGGATANHIAKWDGYSWSGLSSGINWTVYSLINYGNNLVAGGLFTSAGGIVANNIAEWDGIKWFPLGKGIGNPGDDFKYVFAMQVYNNNLYAGGMFSSAGGIKANGIAKWDGNAWSSINEGVSCESPEGFSVNTLMVHENELYAGGVFIDAGEIKSPNIARWKDLEILDQLVFFNVQKDIDSSEVIWKTATPDANDLFIIEKSKEGRIFERGGMVTGMDSTNIIPRYEWTDINPYPTTYYRITAVDLNGNEKYSKTMEVMRDEDELRISPTVVYDYIHLYPPAWMHKAIMNITDLNGNKVVEEEITFNGEQEINLGFLAKGSYIISVTDGNVISTFTIMKQ